jgi:hypothetical protein
MARAKRIAIVTWVVALSTMVLVELSLRATPAAPPPPAPPPPPEAPCHTDVHADLTRLLAQRIADGRDLLWVCGFSSDAAGSAVSPDVFAIASQDRATLRHRLEFAVADRTCAACGVRAVRPAASFDYALLRHGAVAADINRDGWTELQVPSERDARHVYQVRGYEVRRLTPEPDGDAPRD